MSVIDSSATSAMAAGLDARDDDQDLLLRHPVGDDAGEQRRQQDADGARGRDDRQLAGPPPIRMTSQTRATTHRPPAKLDSTSATASLR